VDDTGAGLTKLVKLALESHGWQMKYIVGVAYHYFNSAENMRGAYDDEDQR